ncbi:hypothetical protein ACQR3V_29245 [Rhodococcus erythropolis]|uniref:hypothetical protein n=1 Tax=Rhodococcus erythropolis TaxID=1833 RepID=UPI003D10A2C1
MYILFMRFTSRLDASERAKLTAEGLPVLRKLSGLIQKYYVADRVGTEVGGIYVWEDLESLKSYLNGPIVASISDRYATEADPDYEILEVRHYKEFPENAAQNSALTKPMVGSVRFRTTLSSAELSGISIASLPNYDHMSDLLAMYRVTDVENGRVGGIYIWQTEAALDENFASPTVAGIEEVYRTSGSIDIRGYGLGLKLRD